MSTYLPWLLRSTREGAQGGAPKCYSKGRRWPNVDGASSLPWNFIGFPHKPSYSASFLLNFPTTPFIPILSSISN